ncbi:expressed unknown protein [Seminavis robusta]|uniref:Sulfotransferase domain-containing protein n=1 Tax=Seminavis robusta TaxID=568900 RepID=A0A9N8F361_9STRA|nr:expressed unknown protein [Seminavis robusta]|eukprot:Sro2885_g339360.1 n/a (416) ;mRNA; r:3748-4995
MTQVRRPSAAKPRSCQCLCWFLLLGTLFWLVTEHDIPDHPSAVPAPFMAKSFDMLAMRNSNNNNNDVIDNAPVDPTKVLDEPHIYQYRRNCHGERPTLASIQACYPDATLHFGQQTHNNPPSSSSCDQYPQDQPLTWSFVQECLAGRHTSTNNKISQIHVIGERNSGTKWLQQELAQCFPKSVARSHRDFLRSKHFFQPPVRGMLSESLVIAIVRSPDEWLAAMREKPYHMPFHMNGYDSITNKVIPLDWDEFTKRQTWTMPLPHQEFPPKEGSCVQGFSFTEVSPCLFNDTSIVPRNKWRGHMPVYELQRDGSGIPFSHLLDLRAEKILNFVLEVPLLMALGGFLAVRYEDLVKHGTQGFLEQVAHLLDLQLPSSCKPQPPRPERLGRRTIPSKVRMWMEERLVLETEQLLGYR